MAPDSKHVGGRVVSGSCWKSKAQPSQSGTSYAVSEADVWGMQAARICASCRCPGGQRKPASAGDEEVEHGPARTWNSQPAVTGSPRRRAANLPTLSILTVSRRGISGAHHPRLRRGRAVAKTHQEIMEILAIRVALAETE